MNDFQICFIICTNDHNKLEDCLTHIGKLEIPDGYEIDLITIEDAASIAEGYQNAMAQSNAKYKIYLHQDVCILNQRMLFEMLDIFLPNPSIGLLGVVGYKRVAQSGIMWESPSGYGELYENRSEEAYCLHKKPFGLYEEVAMIDGVLMCTQYDIPWRTDLLKGWHFYDASCSMEYLHAGYHIVVPKQFETWCIHKCGIPSIKDYDKERLIFVQEYNLKSLTLIRQALEAEEYQQALSQIEAYKSIWEYGEYIAVLESDTLIHLAQYEAARSCIQQGLTYDSNSCELYYMLGEVYELCEQQILARLCYHYALFLCQNPSDSEYFRKNLNRFDQCHTMVSPRIAILLKASRNLEWLTNCIKQIRLYNVSDSYEIILMESDTSEEVHNWIANQQDLTVRICPPQQEGSIYNLGIDAVQDSADIAIIEEGALPLAHSFFNLQMELYAHSQIGAVSAARESSIFTDFEAATQYAVLHNSPGHHSEDKIQLSDPIVLIRRSALKQIGWFDTQFSHYFYQIYDLGFRLLQNHFLQKSCAISAYKTMNPNHMIIGEPDFIRFSEKWNVNPAYSCHTRHDLIDMIHYPESGKLKVLEVGCACGATLLSIKSQYPNTELYGIELDAGAASIARHIATISHEDIEKSSMDYPQNFFDYIILGDVLEHLRDPQNVIRTLRLYLKTNGQILASIPNVMHISNVHSLLQGNWTYEDAGILDRTHLRFFTYQEILRMFEAADFTVEQMRNVKIAISEKDTALIATLAEIGKVPAHYFESYQYLIGAMK